MVIEYFSIPGLAVVVAVDDHTIAPTVIDDEGDAVVFGGLHPVVGVGTHIDVSVFAPFK